MTKINMSRAKKTDEFKIDGATIEVIEIPTEDIINPLIEEAKSALTILKKIIKMKEAKLMTWEERKWMGRYLGVYCSVRNVTTPPHERCEELLKILEEMN